MQLPEKRGMSFRRQMFIERYRLSRYSDQREQQGNLRRVDRNYVQGKISESQGVIQSRNKAKRDWT